MTSELPPDWQPQYVALNNIPITRALCHDGKLVTGLDIQQTKRALLAHTRAIGFLAKNWVSYWETCVCRAQPPGSRLCRFVDDSAPVVHREPRVMRLGDVLLFVKTMAAWVAAGGQTVEQQEAQRRADVCQRCPLNIEVGGCTGCVDFAGQVLRALNGRHVTGAGTLRSCGVCSCSIPAMVWLPLEVLGEHDGLPSWCWKRADQS